MSVDLSILEAYAEQRRVAETSALPTYAPGDIRCSISLEELDWLIAAAKGNIGITEELIAESAGARRERINDLRRHVERLTVERDKLTEYVERLQVGIRECNGDGGCRAQKFL